MCLCVCVCGAKSEDDKCQFKRGVMRNELQVNL